MSTALLHWKEGFSSYYRARFTPTAFLFSKKAIVLLNVPTAEEFERLWEIAIELGAEDIINLAEDEEGAKAANADASEIEVEVRQSLVAI